MHIYNKRNLNFAQLLVAIHCGHGSLETVCTSRIIGELHTEGAGCVSHGETSTSTEVLTLHVDPLVTSLVFQCGNLIFIEYAEIGTASNHCSNIIVGGCGESELHPITASNKSFFSNVGGEFGGIMPLGIVTPTVCVNVCCRRSGVCSILFAQSLRFGEAWITEPTSKNVAVFLRYSKRKSIKHCFRCK